MDYKKNLQKFSPKKNKETLCEIKNSAYFQRSLEEFIFDIENTTCFCGSDNNIANCCLFTINTKKPKYNDEKNKKKSDKILSLSINRIVENILCNYAYFENFKMKCFVKINNTECYNEPIKNHSLSNKANLRGHDLFRVIGQNQKLSFVKTYPDTTSIFRAICGDCDKKFSHLDNPKKYDYNYILQNHYRSLCNYIYTRELLKKRKDILFNFFSFIKNEMDKRGFQDEIINNMYEIKELLIDPLNEEILKISYKEKEKIELHLKNDLTFDTGKNKELFYRIIEINTEKNIAFFCSHYRPCYSFHGKEPKNKEKIEIFSLNKETHFVEDFSNEHLTMTVLENDSKTYLIMSCLKENKNMIKFIKDFLNQKNINGIINRYALLLPNVFFKKSFVNKLNENKSHKQSILDYQVILESVISKHYMKDTDKIYKDILLTEPFDFENINNEIEKIKKIIDKYEKILKDDFNGL